MSEVTEVVRHFNRTWTQRIGVLEESYLDLGRPLGASRLVFEIGTAGAGVGELRDRLGLDSGYLSRLLRGLAEADLAVVEPDPDDARRRRVRLTPAGHTAYDELEQRSQAGATALVAPLTPRQQDRLADALATADLLVRAATVELRRVSATDPVATAAVERYYDELRTRFPAGFDPGPSHLDAGAFVIATSDGDVVGCGGLQPLGDGVGEVKRMWVDPTWRGAGLGARLLRHLEQVARDLAMTRVVLDTNDTLTEAIALYERAGYDAVAAYNDNPYARHWFAKDLT